MSSPRSPANSVILGVVVLNLLFLGLAGLRLYRSLRRHEAQAVLNTQNLAHSLAISISGALDKVDLGLFDAAREVERQMGSGSLRTEALKVYLARQQHQIRDFEALWVADAKGDVRWGTRLPSGGPVNIADRDYFKRIAGAGDPGLVISRPVMGRVTQAWSILVSRRVNRPDGSFAGLVLGSLRVEDYFTRKFSEFDVGRWGRIALRDENLGLVTRYSGGTGEIGLPGSKAISAMAMPSVAANPRSGTYWAKAPEDGLVRLYSYQKIAGYPYYLFVGRSRREILYSWWLEVVATLLSIAGLMTFSLLYGRDAFRRLKAKETQDRRALAESEARFRAIVDHSHDGILFTDAQARILYRSPSYAAIDGFTEHERLGRTGFEAVHPEDLPPLRETWARMLAHPEAHEHAQHRLRHADGTWRRVDSTLQNLLDLAEVGAVIVSTRDITDQKRAEEELRESRANLAALIESTEDMIWSVDAGYRLLTFNACYAEHLRISYGSEPKLGYRLEDRLPMDQVSPWTDRYRRALAEGPFRWEFTTPDGKILDLAFSPILRDGKATGVSVFGKDITQRRKTEQALAASQLQLNHLHRLESVGRLAGGISHDMNNVLAAIMAVAETLKHLQSERSDQVDLILEAARRGRNLLKGLTAFARKERAELEDFDLNELLGKEAEILSSTTLQRIKVVLDLAPGLPRLTGSPSALATAVMNLCMNSVDAMQGGGTLTLRTRPAEGGGVELVVEDTGHGMAPEVLARAMEPFFTTKPVGQGTGLGLAMVFGTVQAHGGTLELRSQTGKGTAIHILLPQGRRDLAQPGAPSAFLAGPGLRRLRILLVDDDLLVRRTTLLMLEAVGHQVTDVEGGQEALRLATGGQDWEVAVLDVNMPGLNGLETLTRLRELRPALPAVLATGHPDEEVLRYVAGTERVVLLAKPFTLQEFLGALQAVAP